MKRHDWLAVKHCGISISLGCFLLLLSRSLSKSLSSFLPHLAAWLRRPKTLPRRLNTLNPGLRPWPPRTPRSARSASPPSRVGAVQFDPLITVVTIPSIAELPAEKRGHLWWQPHDFVNFLRTRLDIAEAYKAAAQSLGVDMFNVSSVGPHAKAAYVATMEAYPSLKDESRRGLGLGRRHERARNRDAYLAAVINEQGRQHQMGSPYDAEALASAARRVSQKDREYAHFLAKMYYEQDHASDADEGMKERLAAAKDESPKSPQRSTALTQIFMEEADDRSPQHGQSCPSSKGFGLSREKLREVGLSATGHVLSKSQRCRESLESLGDEWSDAGSDFD